jgi:acetylglutamate kinase
MTLVIKISGSELDDPAYLARFAAAVRDHAHAVCIVHGGGKEISDMQRRMGIEPRYVDGVRVTDAESLALVEMVLCGTINTRLVRVLVNAGVEALGVSGADRGIVRAANMHLPDKPDFDMGFTGEVTGVRGDVLRAWLESGITPVIAPICLGESSSLNVNADHVAGAVAGAVGAERLVFLSNVPGVLAGGAVVRELNRDRTEALISDGTISGGMIPKVRTAVRALANGARAAVITDLHGLLSGGGTVFIA